MRWSPVLRINLCVLATLATVVGSSVHCGVSHPLLAGFRGPQEEAGPADDATTAEDGGIEETGPFPDVGSFDFDSPPRAAPEAAADCGATEDACVQVVGCGNGKIDPGLNEQCDDGNTTPGDGCSATCQLEQNYICPMPGKPCVSTVVCGDGRVSGAETCDDGNVKGGDGCSAMCQIETGWICPQPGLPCVVHCGDGILLGTEQCDPPNPGKGCSASCKFEPGMFCDPPPMLVPDAGPVPPSTCRYTSCGNGVKEGNEACDDGNLIDGDGCSATCALEPDCSSGTCLSKCGDSIILPPEACDDGNTVDGDGCSMTCHIEPGWACTPVRVDPPLQLNLAGTFRDFISLPTASNARHPDFESNVYGAADTHTPGLVQSALDAAGKPVLAGPCSATQPATFSNPAICPWQQQMSVQANYSQWYRDTPGINIPMKGSVLLPRLANGSYVFDSANLGFFPFDNKGWVALGNETTGIADDGLPHNFGFTTEIRYFFQYQGGEILDFTGDDDVWVFVNRKLALDLGGLHQREGMTLTMDTVAAGLGIVKGGLYEIVLFHAERHTMSSNFKLTLTGFSPTHTTCLTICGDGIVAGMEQCDPGAGDGGAAGGYNGCTADCRRGPFCGDAIVNGPEQCDDGVNLTLYSPTKSARACGPGCLSPDYCGDGKLDSLFGEQCDNGPNNNDSAYNGCTTKCQLGPRCGDGIVQAAFGEECDDGNAISGDGCDNHCRREAPH